MVEINTKKLDPALKEPIFKRLTATTKALGINTEGYSPRPLVIQITTHSVNETLVYKTTLIMGEEMRRLDDNEEVFAITYQMSDSVEPDDVKEEVLESVDFLLDQFAEQFREDNE